MSAATYEIPCAPCPDWRDVGGAHQFVLTNSSGRPIKIHRTNGQSFWATYRTFNAAVVASIRVGQALDTQIAIRDKQL